MIIITCREYPSFGTIVEFSYVFDNTKQLREYLDKYGGDLIIDKVFEIKEDEE